MTVRGAAPEAPPYGQGTLAELVPSLVAGMGVAGERDSLGLEAGARVCLLVVDGLGLTLLRRHSHLAPFLAEVTVDTPGSGELRAGFPTTTATSLASLGTGLPPSEHGMLGYKVAVPGTDRVLNALHWDAAVDPLDWQRCRTAFERAAEAGVAVSHVAPSAFAGSGLTRAALRGPRYLGADSVGARVALTADALSRPGPSLVLAYHGDLDATGHRHGTASAAWRHELVHTDRFVEQLAHHLPSGSTLVVTADHGMVDVPAGDRVDAETDPALAAGVRVLAGEPRARYVHAREGAAPDVLAAWQAVLGEAFCVVARDEALDAGWFGPQPGPRVRDRVGDVVAVAYGTGAVVASRSEAKESRLVGMHGALTDDEALVPLLVRRP